MKRAFSDSEGDDGFAEDDTSTKMTSPSIHGGSSRKKRRGIIEKRRRDRINQSLGELRRLVPAAFEKQGSAKLEKAEILQMTVDHLKLLASKGLNGYNVDTTALALDYRSIGFRECMSEVSRYLVSVEGLDIQDPLRIRLGSHLQCYSAQREIASKAAAGLQASAPTSWNYPTTNAFQSQYNTSSYSSLTAPSPHTLPQPSHPSHTDPLSMSTQSRLPTYPDSGRLTGGSQMCSLPPLPSSGSAAPHVLPGSTSTASTPPQGGLPGLSQMASQFPSSSMLSPHHHPYPSSNPSSSTSSFQQASLKHHRPWGADLAF